MGVTPRAFYNDKGLVPTWHEAQRFAGEGGRIATLPDIIDTRLEAGSHDVPWTKYFTTSTAEYVGIGRNGRKLIIVAHGVGPLSTIDGITAAYKHEYGDGERNNRGGRIPLVEFRKLEDGVYGFPLYLSSGKSSENDSYASHDVAVFIIDYEDYSRRYQYPFLQTLHLRNLRSDPLFLARIGGYLRRDRYLAMASTFAAKEKGIDYHPNPYLVGLKDAPNCIYRFYPKPEEQADSALAHLLSISQLTHVSHHVESESRYRKSLLSEIGCYEWSDGCRFVAVPRGITEATIRPEWNVWQLMADHWQEMMMPVAKPGEIGLRPLVKLGGAWFTGRLHKGVSMPTGSPEYLVTSMQQVGEPQTFMTDIVGYHAFFRYDMREAGHFAPPGANAFVMGQPEIVWSHNNPVSHTAPITFYKIEVDTQRRLPKREEIAGNYDMLMRLSGE